MIRFRRLAAFVTGLAFGLILTLPTPTDAYAQQQQQRAPSHSSPSSVNLPTWAEPNQGRSSFPDAQSGGTFGGGQQVQKNQMQGPASPSAPQQAPLGGLELLALAGAGYAAKRLRDRKGDEDENLDDDATA
ncbi:MAG: hypothetical protein BRD45_06835 [Bacteroidetes bacterium QS_8_64_10]|nr:MAG: hypothetical protein BRD45_06835 [Bacteroidetes bacterium QS_8_64_10]